MIDAGTLEWISAPYSHKTAEGGSEANQQELNVVLKELAAKGAKVVLFGGTSGHVTPILNAAVSAGMVGRTSGCTWIGFDGFYSADQDTLKSMRGSLRLMASGCPGGPNENPLVQSLKSVDVPALLAKHTDHSIQVDTADSVKIGTVESVGCGVGFAYDAMWLAALSFSQLAVNNDVTETCSGTCEVSETQKQRGRSYFEFILNTTFSGASGQVTLLSNGDRPGSSVAVSIENDQDDGSGSFSMQWLGEITGTGGAFELPSTIIWADGTSTLPTDGNVYTL
jgi:ABC-type branched-subunit amino acid transport system substrate-binding protein